jgi:hypothetical protein
VDFDKAYETNSDHATALPARILYQVYRVTI